jgi:hypothetical protein
MPEKYSTAGGGRKEKKLAGIAIPARMRLFSVISIVAFLQKPATLKVW